MTDWPLKTRFVKQLSADLTTFYSAIGKLTSNLTSNLSSPVTNYCNLILFYCFICNYCIIGPGYLQCTHCKSGLTFYLLDMKFGVKLYAEYNSMSRFGDFLYILKFFFLLRVKDVARWMSRKHLKLSKIKWILYLKCCS